LACEYRIHKPSFAIIAIGTDDYLSPERFETNLRQIVEMSINLGIVPILFTQMDNANLLDNNAVIVKVANAYDLPLVDLMQAAQLLPNQGLLDHMHPSGLTNAFVFSEYNLTHYGWPVRNLAVLTALDQAWRSVSP
jgi:lysophospholipase L1-like esterase